MLDQESLARSDPKDIDAGVTAHNRQNKGFGQGITPKQSSFLHGLAHAFRLERSGGETSGLSALASSRTHPYLSNDHRRRREAQ